MALTPGTRLGVYDVTAQLRVGGMGEVYRAIDTKLKRHISTASFVMNESASLVSAVPIQPVSVLPRLPLWRRLLVPAAALIVGGCIGRRGRLADYAPERSACDSFL